VTYLGVGTLVPITGNMNSEKYINTLDQYLWPVVDKQLGNSGEYCGKGLLYMELLAIPKFSKPPSLNHLDF
jgi:hypothetical protein